MYWQVSLWWPLCRAILSFVSSHAQTPPSDKEETSLTVMVPWFPHLHNVTRTFTVFFTNWNKVTFSHTRTHKGSFNDVQAHLRQFHLEVEQGRRAIPIDLETSTSLQKRYKADHRGAYVHQAGGGSTHSDVEVRINCRCGHSPRKKKCIKMFVVQSSGVHLIGKSASICN